MRPIRVTTETAIPTVFQMFVEAAEVGTAEEVGGGEAIGCQEVTSGTLEVLDGETVRVADVVGKTAADLVGDEVWVRMGVGEEVGGVVIIIDEAD